MRFAVLQHAEFEHAGILRDFMRADGIEFDVAALDEGDNVPALDPYDALIVLGGRWGRSIITIIPGSPTRRR